MQSYRQGQYGAAYDLYNSLLDSAEPGTDEHADITTNARAAHAHLDFVTSSFAGALDALPSAITSALESAPPPVLPSASTSTSIITASAPVSSTAPKRAVRKKRIPKGITPGVSPAPDPERWLKKTERTSYVPPRGKKRAGGGATQGFTPAVESVASGAGATGGGGKKKGKKK